MLVDQAESGVLNETLSHVIFRLAAAGSLLRHRASTSLFHLNAIRLMINAPSTYGTYSILPAPGAWCSPVLHIASW